MFQTVIQTWGGLDILVANAGIQQDAPITEMSLAQWNQVLAVNLTGQFFCAREAVREFVRRGVTPELSCAAGKIICISSVHDIIPWAGHVNYAASKGGLLMFMKSLAQEVASEKIRHNVIHRRRNDAISRFPGGRMTSWRGLQSGSCLQKKNSNTGDMSLLRNCLPQRPVHRIRPTFFAANRTLQGQESGTT